MNQTANYTVNHTAKTIFLAAAIVGSATFVGVTQVQVQAAPPVKAPQKVIISLPAGYKTAAATVKAGQPVALTFVLRSDAGCGNTVSVPAAKWKRSLQVGQKATLIYTPKKSGSLAFECGMSMYKGSVTVK